MTPFAARSDGDRTESRWSGVPSRTGASCALGRKRSRPNSSCGRTVIQSPKADSSSPAKAMLERARQAYSQFPLIPMTPAAVRVMGMSGVTPLPPATKTWQTVAGLI